jgi:hypothetical protein
VKACEIPCFPCRALGGVSPGFCGRMARRGWGDRANVSACWTRERVEPVSFLGRCSDLLSLLGIHLFTLLRMLCHPSTCQMVVSVTQPGKMPKGPSPNGEGHVESVTGGACSRPLPFTTVNRASSEAWLTFDARPPAWVGDQHRRVGRARASRPGIGPQRQCSAAGRLAT